MVDRCRGASKWHHSFPSTLLLCKRVVGAICDSPIFTQARDLIVHPPSKG
jgi:hypothetical protein